MSLHHLADGLLNIVKGSPAEVTRSFPVQSRDPFTVADIQPGEHYFSVYVDEIYISKGQQWLSEWDPMALVVTEFSYGGKATVLPFVVGPSLLKLDRSNIPSGVSCNDTLVAGPYPYLGGSLAITVILARVRRVSYGRRILEFLESVANTVPAGASLLPHLKIAGAVMDGVEALFGMKGDVQPLKGHRWEYDSGREARPKPGYFALVNADNKSLDPSDFSAIQRRLHHGTAAPAGFRDKDFLLYSLQASDARKDYANLPFHSLFKKALALASSLEPGTWERAKASLAVVYQEMLTGPDLTFADATKIFDDYKSKLVTAHNNVKGLPELGPAEIGLQTTKLATDLGLPTSHDGRDRIDALARTAAILDL